jgi:UDP-N-acetylglucosamine:LPS N-acetylglucosamine transferase
MSDKQKILFLYLKTGGGHLSAAKALSGEIKEYFDDEAEAVIVDAVPPDAGFRRDLLEKGYGIMVNENPWMWKLTYNLSRLTPFVWSEMQMVYYGLRTHIRSEIKKHKPDKIVFLHFLLVDATLRILEEEGWDHIKHMSIVLDPYTAHPIWYYRRDNPLIAFSHRVKNYAVNRFGYDPDMIAVYPLLLKKEFEKRVPKDKIPALKEKYGFDPKKRLTLFAGGGDGIRSGEDFLEQALKQNLQGEVAFVCGKNKHLKEACEHIVHRYGAETVKVYGFVNFMYDLMSIADVVVTKGGPATVMETLMLHKPLMLVFYVYGQEQGNVDYVVQKKVGQYNSSPKSAIKTIASWLEDPHNFEKMQKRIDKLGLSNGTFPIVDHILHKF